MSMERKVGCNLKRIISVILLSVTILIFSGCILHQGERPTDYGPAKWISNDPNIWFEVLETDDKLGTNRMSPIGQIILGNRSIDFTMHFDGGITVYFYNADGKSGLLFSGTCNFSIDNLIVKINKNKDTVFNGEIDQIVFKREINVTSK